MNTHASSSRTRMALCHEDIEARDTLNSISLLAAADALSLIRLRAHGESETDRKKLCVHTCRIVKRKVPKEAEKLSRF